MWQVRFVTDNAMVYSFCIYGLFINLSVEQNNVQYYHFEHVQPGGYMKQDNNQNANVDVREHLRATMFDPRTNGNLIGLPYAISPFEQTSIGLINYHFIKQLIEVA